MAKLSIVPKLSAGTVVLDDIPADFIEEFEAAYADYMKNPDKQDFRVEFEDEPERNQWLTWARSYGEQRVSESGDPAFLTVRATPKRGLPRTIAYLSVTADIEANGNANAHPAS